MAGRLIDGVSYMYLMNDNMCKKWSLADNIYFTLRDVFINADNLDDVMMANYFNDLLTNGVYFEDRSPHFNYDIQLLANIQFMKKLKKWLHTIVPHSFVFYLPDSVDDTDDDISKYMKWDDWWSQFIELRCAIDAQYEMCCMCKEEDVQRHRDRRTEDSH